MAKRKDPEEPRSAAAAEREVNQLQDAIDTALENLRVGKIARAIGGLQEYESEEPAEGEDD